MSVSVVSIRNRNHPQKGSSTKVEPIRELAAIAQIKAMLKTRPRDLCLLTFGINSAYRANELASLTYGQARHLKVGDRLDVKQSKNSRYRAVTVNKALIKALAIWLPLHPDPRNHAPLFPSRTTGGKLTTGAIHNMVKHWCSEAGLHGNYGSHTLRKTFGYHQRKTFGMPLVLITRAFGHASEIETMDYLCIQPEEIEDLYKNCL